MMVTRFVLAVHCHQPVGNFSWVFEEAYEAAYRPFLEMLERYPKVRVVFHYSGALLDWFQAQHPEFLRRLKRLVQNGQAEVLGGGYYEPILTMIPQRDALGQLSQMDSALRRLGLTAKARDDGSSDEKGIWLPERVWEPELPSLLRRAGISYTVVDDHHFALAGLPEGDRFGYYLTEDRGAAVALFPSSKRLRYLVPFKPVEEVIETLRQFQSERSQVVVLADDGEKFGLWPGTHKWVYQEGWLEAFFQQLSRQEDWLRLMTFRDCLKELPPLGRLYIPCASYEEMTQWSGGFFRNFLVKYPEADAMHKKMLWISDRVERLRLKPKAKGAKGVADRLRVAERHLYMAQSNDAYWHGIFGGVYLRHLRRSVYANLLKAEQALDESEEKNGWVREEAVDLDADQMPELLLRSKWLTLQLDADRGGQLVELSDKAAGLNLLDTLTRRPEAYHEKVRSVLVSASIAQGSGPSSIHEQEQPLGADLADSLVYDPYRRAGLIDHGLSPQAGVRDLARGAAEELGDFIQGAYTWKVEKSGGRLQAVLSRTAQIRTDGVTVPVKMRKTVGISGRDRKVSVSYRLANSTKTPVTFLFGSEMRLNLKDAHVNRIGEADGLRRFSVADPAARLEVSWAFNRPARLWHFPVETVSDSERGMERTYQGVSLTFLWPLTLPPLGSWGVQWELAIGTAGP